MSIRFDFGFGFDLILIWLDFDPIWIGFRLIPREIVEAPSEILGEPRKSYEGLGGPGRA